MKDLLQRLRWWLQRDRFERELDEEMRFHLAIKAANSGSRYAANEQFGNIMLMIKENSRAMWTFIFWEQFAQDIRYGLRTMTANRLFTAMAVLLLALGIGANTAIYSFMDAVLLRILPVHNPLELVIVKWRSTGNPAVIHGQNGSRYRDGKHGSASPNYPYAAYELLRSDQTLVSPCLRTPLHTRSTWWHMGRPRWHTDNMYRADTTGWESLRRPVA
jgi:macrolide transport system ATP-binding/permease protein